MAGIYTGESESAKMGLVEIIEPSDVAYFTAHLLDIDESGQKILVRCVVGVGGAQERGAESVPAGQRLWWPRARACLRAGVVSLRRQDLHSPTTAPACVCRYQNEDETTWVEAARVRACPAARSEREVAQFTPQAGEKVEVLFIEEECGTESWWLGTVQSAKGLYFKVSFPDGEDSETQEVVEQERMRPVSGHNPAKFVRRLFRIPAGQASSTRAYACWPQNRADSAHLARGQRDIDTA